MSEILACPLDFRYGRPQVKAIFSEEGKLARLLAVEAALARAQARLGDVPAAAAEEIARRADTKHVTPARVAEIEAEIRHDLMAVVKALTEQCQGDAGRFVHLGVTSYDVIDCANALMMKDAFAHLDAGLADLERALARLAHDHRDTVMLGRTHGQAAVPMTFGLKMAVFLLETRRHRDRLREARPRVVVGKMAGAVGTAAGLGPKAFEVARLVGEDLGIGMEDGATQIVQRDRYVEAFQVLANLAASLEKFATEVRNLQRTEIAEAAEGFDVAKQVGSSTMAQKRNPVLAEKISGLARIVRSAVVPAYENAIQWHERDLANSSAERFLLPHTFVLADEIVQDSARLYRELGVFPDRMRRNLAAAPEIMSESVMLRLVDKGLGRQEAHELVRRLAMTGRFREALEEDPTVAKLLSKKDLENALEPASYTGHAGSMVDRALALVERAPSP